MIISFSVSISSKGDDITVRPMEYGKTFPQFNEWDCRNGKVIGWYKPEGASISQVKCFEFGYLGDVELVSVEARKVVFRRIPPATPPVHTGNGQQEARGIALAFERITPASGSDFDKSFMNSVKYQAGGDKQFSAAQIKWIYALLYKYRRQMPEIYEKHKDHPDCKKHER